MNIRMLSIEKSIKTPVNVYYARFGSAKPNSTTRALVNISNHVLTTSVFTQNEQKTRKLQGGVTVVQTAQSSIDDADTALKRIRELVRMAADEDLTAVDLAEINQEIGQLAHGISESAEITRNKINTAAENTKNAIMPADSKKDNTVFDIKVKTLQGEQPDLSEAVVSAADNLLLAIPDQAAAVAEPGNPQVLGYAVSLKIDDIDANFVMKTSYGLGLDNLILTDRNSAEKAIALVDKAIDYVSDTRGDLGAVVHRLEYRIDYLNNYAANLEEALSRIQDDDIEKEAMQLAKSQIIQQANQFVLSQTIHSSDRIKTLLQAL